MNFFIPEHCTNGTLNGDDLNFFYYDIGMENLQGWPEVYDWDSIVEEFEGILDIDSCTYVVIDDKLVQNKIRFTVSNQKDSDNGSKSAAFFRHLRNAFAHYQVVREGDNYILMDRIQNNITMRGLINAELLMKFCFRFFDMREKLISEHENNNNPIHENL